MIENVLASPGVRTRRWIASGRSKGDHKHQECSPEADRVDAQQYDSIAGRAEEVIAYSGSLSEGVENEIGQ